MLCLFMYIGVEETLCLLGATAGFQQQYINKHIHMYIYIYIYI